MHAGESKFESMPKGRSSLSYQYSMHAGTSERIRISFEFASAAYCDDSRDMANDITENIVVSGYSVVSRRDCKKTANWGGILTLQRLDFNGLVHTKHCNEEERNWHFLNL